MASAMSSTGCGQGGGSKPSALSCSSHFWEDCEVSDTTSSPPTGRCGASSSSGMLVLRLVYAVRICSDRLVSGFQSNGGGPFCSFCGVNLGITGEINSGAGNNRVAEVVSGNRGPLVHPAAGVTRPFRTHYTTGGLDIVRPWVGLDNGAARVINIVSGGFTVVLPLAFVCRSSCAAEPAVALAEDVSPVLLLDNALLDRSLTKSKGCSSPSVSILESIWVTACVLLSDSSSNLLESSSASECDSSKMSSNSISSHFSSERSWSSTSLSSSSPSTVIGMKGTGGSRVWLRCPFSAG
jgi:hypothetical protein